ncbi:MAG: hypothetical protein QOF51_3601 [Chloroflexota bacterium]|jgi:hypothetical protein|nr:hypothetical protein [Chloroflexota bacterium]
MRTNKHGDPKIRTAGYGGPALGLYELTGDELPPNASPVLLIILLVACGTIIAALIFALSTRDGGPWDGTAAGAAQTAAADAGSASAALDPAWAAVTENVIREVVASVPGPQGAAVPTIRAMALHPGAPVPVVLSLQLSGVNNQAWNSITQAAQRAYLRDVLQAIERILPRTRPDASGGPARLVAGLYGSYLYGSADLAENSGTIMWPCQLQANGVAQCDVALITEAIELTPGR